MTSPILSAFEQASLGRTCDVQRRETDWVFAFGQKPDGCVIVTDSLWRIVKDGRIALTSEDDNQSFGLPAPLDAQQACRALLDDTHAVSVRVAPVTADVTIQFERDARLEIISSSLGYESWQAYFRHAGEDVTLVGAGGGALSYASAPAGSKATMLVGRPLPD